MGWVWKALETVGSWAFSNRREIAAAAEWAFEAAGKGKLGAMTTCPTCGMQVPMVLRSGKFTALCPKDGLSR